METTSQNAGRTGDPVADVLVIGAGPSGGMVTHTLSQAGLNVICLEQGDWVTSSDFPTSRPEWELPVSYTHLTLPTIA